MKIMSFSFFVLSTSSALGCGNASLGESHSKTDTMTNCPLPSSSELPPQPRITGGYFQNGAAHILFRPTPHPNLGSYILYRTDRNCGRINAGDFQIDSLRPLPQASITRGIEEGELQFDDFTFRRRMWACYTIETETICPQPHPVRMNTYWSLGVP